MHNIRRLDEMDVVANHFSAMPCFFGPAKLAATKQRCSDDKRVGFGERLIGGWGVTRCEYANTMEVGRTKYPRTRTQTRPKATLVGQPPPAPMSAGQQASRTRVGLATSAIATLTLHTLSNCTCCACFAAATKITPCTHSVTMRLYCEKMVWVLADFS